MKTDTADRILAYLHENKHARVADMVRHLGISNQALHKQLANLLASGVIEKTGRAPRVFYSISKASKVEIKTDALVSDMEKFVNANYLYITPDGRKLSGTEGFIFWCGRHKLPIVKTAHEYVRTLEPYLKLRKNNLLDGTKKIANTFDKLWLDKLYYLDFYSIERFGKTKLGQLVLYAKQSQDRKIIAELIAEVMPKISVLAENGGYDAVGFVPPSIKREVQLMKELERSSNFNLPILKIEKIATPIRVPQKSLSKLEDRIENARATFVVTDKNSYDNVILIDDAVGSGATMNEIARKLKEKGIAKIVTGLALVGSYKGFDVISEV